MDAEPAVFADPANRVAREVDANRVVPVENPGARDAVAEPVAFADPVNPVAFADPVNPVAFADPVARDVPVENPAGLDAPAVRVEVEVAAEVT